MFHDVCDFKVWFRWKLRGLLCDFLSIPPLKALCIGVRRNFSTCYCLRKVPIGIDPLYSFCIIFLLGGKYDGAEKVCFLILAKWGVDVI